MKKILLASSALVLLSAAVAEAQALRITGQARMGVQFDDAGYGAWGGADWRTENRLRLNFAVSVEGDHGLTFGAFTRAQMASTNPPVAAGVFSGSRVFVEASGFRLTIGNQDGAIQQFGFVGAQTVGYTGGTFIGSTAGNSIVPQGFDSTGGGYPRIGLQYTFGDTVVALSFDRENAISFESAMEIAIRSRFDAFSVAFGYANRTNLTPFGTATLPIYLDNSAWTTASVAYNGGTWTVGLIASRLEGRDANVSLTGSVELGGGTLNGYVGRYDDGSAATDNNVFGVGYAYGLGGGASLSAGFEQTNERRQGNLGVVFTF